MLGISRQCFLTEAICKAISYCNLRVSLEMKKDRKLFRESLFFLRKWGAKLRKSTTVSKRHCRNWTRGCYYSQLFEIGCELLVNLTCFNLPLSSWVASCMRVLHEQTSWQLLLMNFSSQIYYSLLWSDYDLIIIYDLMRGVLS